MWSSSPRQDLQHHPRERHPPQPDGGEAGMPTPGHPVAGAVFTVKAADGHSVHEIKTGADGTATLENLLPGVYQVSRKIRTCPPIL